TSGALSGSRVFSLLPPAAVGVRGKNRVAYASTSTGIYRANTFATGWRRFSDGLPEGGVSDIVATTDGRLAYALSEHGEGI
ncbi:MAG: hypothetical protein ABJC61_04650, partial [Acidobacteriota bacterium]